MSFWVLLNILWQFRDNIHVWHRSAIEQQTCFPESMHISRHKLSNCAPQCAQVDHDRMASGLVNILYWRAGLGWRRLRAILGRPLPGWATENAAPGHMAVDLLLIAVQWRMYLRHTQSPLRVLGGRHMTSRNDVDWNSNPVWSCLEVTWTQMASVRFRTEKFLSTCFIEIIFSKEQMVLHWRDHGQGSQPTPLPKFLQVTVSK